MLLLAVGALLGVGLYVIDIATVTDVRGSPDYYVDRQMLFVVLGLIVMVAVASIDTTRLQSVPWVLLGGLLGALAVVFVIGSSAKGSTRWIDLGPFSLQPSELGKVVMIAVLAALAVERAQDSDPLRLTVLLTVVAAVPALVVFVQPDLGTAIVYGAILMAVLLLIGAPWQHFAGFAAVLVVLVAMVLAVLPAAGVSVLKDYQVERLTAFVNSDRDRGDAGYQLDQSKTAIGSGGAWGKGADGATQTNNDFLPEHHTDFIFAVVGEMFGFVGAALLVLLFGVVIWRALRITARAASQFEQVVAGGIAAMFMFQAFVNVGMNVGIMPITGIPLPFVSYGGSHTVTNMAAIGLLFAVNRRRVGL
ncbi:MAG TPA: rod shape-determining protein RodA [Miltoncostaeaceae bacterium]|nr:rod shape-determining protein RodA [Miltoncostaeaceae bacterium]